MRRIFPTWFSSLPAGKMASNIREGSVEKSAPRGNAVKRRALCIGINDYPGTGSDLAGCVNDANDWAAAFTDRGFAVKKLIDRRATGNAIRKAIESLVTGARNGDSIVVQYSGHGSFVPDEDGDEPDGTDECLCPYDLKDEGPITDDELFDLFSARPQGARVLMISDSCHSGTVARFAPITTPPTTKDRNPPQRKVRFLPPAAFLSRSDAAKLGTGRARRPSSPPGRYGALLLAGCQDTEYSYDAYFEGRANGAFTFVALRSLASLTAEATYGDWYKAIRRVLPSQQYPQTPNLYGSKSMRSWTVLA
jgi:hypothetical protein